MILSMSQEQPETNVEDDRRGATRRRVLKAGIVAFNGRHSTMPCVVRDLSDTGARLLVTSSIGVPDTFELIIELDGIEANCEVVTRTAREVRVKFPTPPRYVIARRTQIVEAVAPKKAISLRRSIDR